MGISKLCAFAVLMIVASHQTFSGQFTGQTKLDLYVINGKVIEFLIEKASVWTNLNPYHKDCMCGYYVQPVCWLVQHLHVHQPV